MFVLIAIAFQGRQLFYSTSFPGPAHDAAGPTHDAGTSYASTRFRIYYLTVTSAVILSVPVSHFCTCLPLEIAPGMLRICAAGVRRAVHLQ